MDRRIPAAAVLAALALLGGCLTVGSLGPSDCKAKGCFWDESTAQCQCMAGHGAGGRLRDVPGKLEGQ